MEIVDTAGQEEFSSFRDSSVATGDAFLVLFAINSVSSWHELKDLRSKIIQDRQLTSPIPMVLVGNKLVSCTQHLVLAGETNPSDLAEFIPEETFLDL